jgi:hypothetical protein
VHLMHTALVAGWAGSMALYELAVLWSVRSCFKSNVASRYVRYAFYDSF